MAQLKGGTYVGGDLTVATDIYTNTLKVYVQTGTAPFTINSSTNVANLNASYLNGYTTSSSIVGNTIALRDSNGIIYGSYFNFNAADDATAATSYTFISDGGYIRRKTLANVKTELVTSAAVIAGLGFTPSNTSDTVHISGTETITGAKTFNAGLVIGSGQTIDHNATASRDKIRLWTSSSFAIGMDSAYTFGSLNDYATTFQMSNDTGRGWWWGTPGHSNAQGVMGLSVSGLLSIASGARIGYGMSDTVEPSTNKLDVNGGIKSSDGSNACEMKYNTTSKTLDFIFT